MHPSPWQLPISAFRDAPRRAAGVLFLSALLYAPGNARAAASYSVTLQGATQTSTTPLQQSYWTATPGVAPTLINESAAAAAGVVGASTRLQTAWPFDFQTGLTGSASAQATSDDFVITGPAGITSVQGALLFRARIRLDHDGGLAGTDQQEARASVHVAAAGLQADGSCWLGNLDAGGDGVLAGSAPPQVEAAFALTGDFPVGAPFSVTMVFDSRGMTFGDSTVSPGITEADGLEMGLSLGDADGRAMDLPPGYTVNAPGWHLVANVTGVGDAPGGDPTALRLAPATPNPSAGNSVLGVTLPHAGVVSLVVTDAQGRIVRRLETGRLGAGSHDIAWDGRRDSGEPVASGVYFAVLRFERTVLTRRLTRVR